MRLDVRRYVVCVLLWGVAGCGPITTTTAISDATVALEAARTLDAERLATYEYVSAVEYLKKAKEEEGFSDYQAAIDLATEARKFAEDAKIKSMRDPRRGTIPTDDVPEGEPPPVEPSVGDHL